MKRFLPILLCGLLLLNVDLFARGSSSSGGSRSSSFSSSKSSTSSFSSSKASAPATVTTVTKQSSTFSSTSTASTAKPVAVANTQFSNKMAKQDAMSAKKFTTQADAQTAFRKDQAAKYSNSFASEPKTRPDYIPGGIDRGGSHYTVVYHGGGYGYYVGSMWTPLDMAMYMVVTDAMLNSNPSYGYGPQPVYQQPIVYHHSGRTFLIVLGSVCLIGLIIFLLVKMGGL